MTPHDVLPDRQAGPAPIRAPRLAALEGIRCLAMIHLYFYHRIGAAIESPPPWMMTLAEGSYYSTSIFFILSGFILTYVYSAPGGGLRITKSEFWTRRFWRIYPIHVVASLLFVPLFLTGEQHYSGGQLLQSLLPTLLLVHAWIPAWPVPAFNLVSWSASALVFFYAVFPFLLGRVARSSGKALGIGLLMVWCAYLVPPALYLGLGIANSAAEGTVHLVLHMNPVLRLPEFVIGILAGTLFLRYGTRGLPAWLEPLVLLANVAGVFLTSVIPWVVGHNGFFTPLQVALIYVVAGSRSGFARAFAWKPLTLLGASSLTFFFLHGPLSIYVHRVLKALVVFVVSAPGGISAFREAYTSFRYPPPFDAVVFLLVGALTYALVIVIHQTIYEPLTRKWQKKDPRVVLRGILAYPLKSMRPDR